MTRFTSRDRFNRTSASFAEASSCCAKLSAVMGTVFAVSIFVISVLVLRLHGMIMMPVAVTIIISMIIVAANHFLSERTTCLAE